MPYLELILVAVLIVINGILAMSELAVVSSRPARLRGLVEREVRGARQALALSSDPGRFLSTVQIGITLVGILSGAFSGATLGERLTEWFVTQDVPAAWAYVLGVGSVVTVITYLSLIIGELVPKQIALKNPERVACRIAPAMTLLAQLSYPVVWILDQSGKLLLALMGERGESGQTVTEDEIKTIVAEAESSGLLEPNEGRMISSVLRLGDRSVRSVMTPRRDVDMIDITAPVKEILAIMMESPHSRFPVHSGGADIEILGVIRAKDLLESSIGNAEQLRPVIRKAPVIPEALDALDFVDALKKSPVHIGLVHDEYGHFVGIITPADILEAIVGALATEEGSAEEAIIRRADGSLLVAGWTPIDEMADVLGLALPDGRNFTTAAGFIIDAFGHLPAAGDQISVQQWLFEVADLDGRRIDKLLATKRGLFDS